jgi:hypothetical protein
MPLDWVSIRDANTAIGIHLRKILPNCVAAIATEYADRRPDVDAICTIAFTGQWRGVIISGSYWPTRCQTSFFWDKTYFYIAFTYGDVKGQCCCHYAEINNQDLWDFACGEPSATIMSMLRIHMSSDFEAAEEEVRSKLRTRLRDYQN